MLPASQRPRRPDLNRVIQERPANTRSTTGRVGSHRLQFLVARRHLCQCNGADQVTIRRRHPKPEVAKQRSQIQRMAASAGAVRQVVQVSLEERNQGGAVKSARSILTQTPR